MKHGSLFSGIGGFDLAAEWLGWENVFHCEINDFGRKVLNYHFPNSISYEDITKTDFTIHRGHIDVLSGGFPCQPFSMAGKRKGKEDERHLWPQMLRAIREIRPKYIVGENVYGLINWDGGLFFDEAQSDLEAEGYEVIPVVLPAVSVNAPHRRDRVWFIASNTYSDGLLRGNGENEKHTGEGGVNALGNSEYGLKHGDAADTYTTGLQRSQEQGEAKRSREKRNQQLTRLVCAKWQNFPTQFPVCSGDDGLPTELDGITFSKWRNESIKAYGNAIVPQVAYEIFKVIDRLHNYDN